MSETVVFCENYGVIGSTLYLATHNCPITVVIPGNRDLFKFFQVINERVLHNTINLIYLEPYRSGREGVRKISKILHVLPGIIKERRYLKEIFDKYFAELEGCEVFFSGRYYNGPLFYLLKKLGERNRLVHINPFPPYRTPGEQYTPTNIVDLARLIIAKFIYGRDIIMVKFPFVKGILYIPDKFVEKEVDRVIDWDERNEMLEGFDLSRFKIFDVGNYSVIYFGHSIEPDMVSDRDTVERELNEIFNILSKYFPENRIACKHHPGHKNDKTMIEIGDALEAFIPAEFLYSEKVKVYLSLWSVSIAHVEAGLPVSLIYLVSLKSDKLREQLREHLIQHSRSEILFPKSLDEFERILANLVK